MAEHNWRSIECKDIKWDAIPVDRRIPRQIIYALYRWCSSPSDSCANEKRWHTLNLGQLADHGETWWRHYGPEHAGPRTIELIKLAIDHAAAGTDITRNIDAYIPQPIPQPLKGHEKGGETND